MFLSDEDISGLCTLILVCPNGVVNVKSDCCRRLTPGGHYIVEPGSSGHVIYPLSAVIAIKDHVMVDLKSRLDKVSDGVETDCTPGVDAVTGVDAELRICASALQ
jgi:hypothetical protein